MSDCEVGEEEWQEEINLNTCDRCGERVFPSETYVVGQDRQLCRVCMEMEKGEEE